MRDIIKSWAIEYKGKKCEICGYSRCQEALDFHHLNPKEKDFSISDRNLPTSDWPRIKNELDKCILVCANCHREIHDGLYSIEELKKSQIFLEDIAKELVIDRNKKFFKEPQYCK